MDPKNGAANEIAKKKETETANTATPDNPSSEGNTTDKTTSVSMEEYESIKKSNQEAQRVIKEYKRKEQEALDQAKLADQQKLEEKGEFEQLKTQWNNEKESFTQQMSSLSEENTSLKATIQHMADDKMAKVKEQLGEEKFTKVQKLIGSDDPQVIITKLPEIVELLGVRTQPVSGGTKLPNGKGSSDITNIQEKIENKERISPREREALLNSL